MRSTRAENADGPGTRAVRVHARRGYCVGCVDVNEPLVELPLMMLPP